MAKGLPRPAEPAYRTPVPSLPPGPRLPVAAQTALSLIAPSWFSHFCHRRYGDCYTLRLFGFGTEVHLANPADIHAVVQGDATTFHAGEANAVLTEVVGARSVFVLDEAEHRRVRNLMLPAFHGDSIRQQTMHIARITGRETATWPLHEAFPMLPRMRSITFEVILRTVMGVEDQNRRKALEQALTPLVHVGSPLLLFPPKGRLGRSGPWKRYALVRERARAMLLEEIGRARAAPDLDARTDALSVMVRGRDEDGLGLVDDELCDQLVTLLLAGHETTATALAWTFERIARNPELLRRCVAAADDDDQRFLEAVCKESLRIRPVVGEIGRQLTAPTTIAGYELPAGVMIVPTIPLVHSSALHYRAPHAFQPQRFQGRFDATAWLPFGGGLRRCLGAAFASLEMRTVLREVLRRVEIETTEAPPERARARHVTLIPHKGALITIRSRRPEPASPSRPAGAARSIPRSSAG